MFDVLLLFPITLLVLSLLTFYLSIAILKRQASSVKWCGVIMLAAANWAMAYGFQLLSTGKSAVLFWVTIQYLSIASLPAIWIVFCLKFTGRDTWLSTKYILLFFLLPVLTLFFLITNEFHHLYYESQHIFQNGPLQQMRTVPGPWYKIHAAYFYSFMAWGLYLLISSYRYAHRTYKKQYLVIISGALIPWIGNLAFLIGYRPYNIDITSYCFIVTALVVAHGLRSLKLFDIIPVGFSKAVEQMSDGLIILNKDNVISHVNNATTALFGNNQIKVGEKIDATISDLKFLEIITGNNGGRTELSLSQYGIDSIYEIRVSPIYDRGEVNGSILIVRDMTSERIAATQLVVQAKELQELNDLKDKLFTVIAHDLRSPFAGIKTWLDLADGGVIDKDEFWEMIPELSKQVQDVSELLDNLFSWAKMQIAGEELKPQLIDLQEFTNSKIHTLRKRAEMKGISIESVVDPGISIVFDPGSLSLIYRNILSNAIKFCQNGDSIRVAAELVPEATMISFIDSGTGIPEDVLSQLFTSFGKTTPGTGKEKGSGFGLAICMEYALKNGATLSVQSEVGKGSTFSLSVPTGGVTHRSVA